MNNLLRKKKRKREREKKGYKVKSTTFKFIYFIGRTN